MSTPVEDSMHELVVILDEANIRLQTEVASLTMLLYDWMLTFNLEVNHVWLRATLSDPRVESEKRIQHPEIVVFGVLAMPDPSRKLSLLYVNLAAGNTVQIRNAEASIINEIGPGIPMCGVTDKLEFLWTFWLPIIVFETLAFSLAAYIAIRKWGIKMLPGEQNATIGEKLVAVFFYDSFIYFSCVFVLFIALCFLYRYTSFSVFSMVIAPVFALGSILANHMLLNLPSTYEKTRHELNLTLPIPLSSIKFEGPSAPVSSSVDNSVGSTNAAESQLSSVAV
ncbi:hypothetical protein SISNIDRAFT_464842 [Sistotremastrum niveocremeum HHB9708]|uniref:DUF6533 domain-containing protein n=1 Tax=Sistotremastrum niveocremeum HHB9708 TaxID=1314777 RepID=A0A164WMS1_9AGAM|nr:hypothetical protein SISNIDRAFT_464842 [Sistotremastrum niveocremeum HHB9708]